jgi:hypothetical protein
LRPKKARKRPEAPQKNPKRAENGKNERPTPERRFLRRGLVGEPGPPAKGSKKPREKAEQRDSAGQPLLILKRDARIFWGFLGALKKGPRPQKNHSGRICAF